MGSLAYPQTAVDMDDVAGDERAAGPGQQQDGAGAFVGIAVAAERRFLCDHRQMLGGCYATMDIGENHTGRHGIDADRRSQFNGQAAGESEDAPWLLRTR